MFVSIFLYILVLYFVMLLYCTGVAQLIPNDKLTVTHNRTGIVMP
uniref:Uncharacterized protein n=1 Tax=Arundo donax TaxID=35708 RepID=A0A0A9C8U7_ARUDO